MSVPPLLGFVWVELPAGVKGESTRLTDCPKCEEGGNRERGSKTVSRHQKWSQTFLPHPYIKTSSVNK